MSMATKRMSLCINLDDDLLDTPDDADTTRPLSPAAYAVLVDGTPDFAQPMDICESERTINRTLCSWMDV